MMRREERRGLLFLLLIAGCSRSVFAQQPLTWEQVKERFHNNNPSLLAARTLIEENRAAEVTAGLRPNPEFSLSADGFQATPHEGVWRPLSGIVETPGASYLIERGHKRQLRVQSARLATAMSVTDQADLERQLAFNLRDAFVRTLQAKSLLELAEENLKYYDHVIDVNRERFKAGDISRADLVRVELQRVQFESDLVNARVNLRTAKIALLALMNEHQPVDTFQVTGDFDFHPSNLLLEDARRAALEARPDLKSASTAVDKARADNRLAWANGTADPVVGGWYSHNPSFSNPFDFNTVGGNVIIPIRIFDKNQGEKARTNLEISRAGRVREGILLTIYRDVDSAYATVGSVRALLEPYRDHYLREALEVRDTVSFAYLHGGASLLDFLDAQKSYRDVQLNYRNLIGSYLSAENQLNLAVGREILP